MSVNTTEKQELNLTGKDFLTLADFSQFEILALLSNAKKIKELKLAGETVSSLKRKNTWNDF